MIEANVYGVEVPGADGKAGMATLVTEDGFDLAVLRAHLAARLPAYARPLFIRIARELAATETFKQKKQDLAAEGFDPAADNGDALHTWMMRRPAPTWRWTPSLFDRISTGQVRL